MQNETVVTDAFEGEDLNQYVPLFTKYEVPVLYNFESHAQQSGTPGRRREQAQPTTPSGAGR